MRKLSARETVLEHKQAQIRTLLLWYRDALETMDRSGDLAYGGKPGSVCLEMGELWHHRSYQELERVLGLFKRAEPALWWHVRERYVTCVDRTVLACPRCEEHVPVQSKHFRFTDTGRTVTLKHKHGGITYFFEPKLVPVVSQAIRPEAVNAGVLWIAKHFRGEPYIPKLLLNKDKEQKKVGETKRETQAA